MRKLIASVALVTAVAVGGLAVAALNPLQLVSAKSSTASTKASEASAGNATATQAAVANTVLDQALVGLVKDGTITQTQATAVKSAIQAKAKEYRAEHKGNGRVKAILFRRALRRGVVKASADAIGVTPKDLRAGLQSGKSIAQIAQAKGVEPQTVVTAIVTAGSTKVDAAVSAGKIDAAQAAKIKQRLPALAAKVVNRLPRHR